MKRIFLLAGEVSGDQLGAWYVARRFHGMQEPVYLEAVGGPCLEQAGIKIFRNFDDLNVIGLTEILGKLPFYYRFMQQLLARLRDGNFDELVLIDFPGFNLRLAKRVHKLLPHVRIVYAAPPQLWCWGAWRIKTIQKTCTEVVVLYPFEVAWYAERGVVARYLGSPVVERVVAAYCLIAQRKKHIAITVGSRATEIAALLPVCVAIIKQLAQEFADLNFVIPCASSYSLASIKNLLFQAGLELYRERIIFVADEQEKMRMLGQCSVAIVKPGTVTLELALLKIPSLMIFKTSWLNNLLARLVMQVPYRALPNLLVGSELVPEFVQERCDSGIVADRTAELYRWFVAGDVRYAQSVEHYEAVRKAMTP